MMGRIRIAFAAAVVSCAGCGAYGVGEHVTAFHDKSGTSVVFERKRTAIASPEYDRVLEVSYSSGASERFGLPRDGGRPAT